MQHNTIYANYAATSPFLLPGVVTELTEYVRNAHLNAGRNFEGLEAGAIALRARRALAELFGVKDPLRVLLTSGATASLNMAINGLARPGDHVLATSLEHNAAARPLEALRRRGRITLDWLQCEPDGSLDPEKVRGAIQKNTRLLVMTHASNVLGTILPAAECFRIAHEKGVMTILDAAQTAAVLPFAIAPDCGGGEIADTAINADLVAFAGHKGLGALAGSGGLIVSERAAAAMEPWLRGGTGSVSESLDMPAFLPDKFEPGTQNTIGALSLAAAAEEIAREGIMRIREREQALAARFIDGLRGMQTLKVCGTQDAARSVPVVSVGTGERDAGEISRALFERHGIITRSGLHCSPLAHKTAGTFPGGTVRFSFGRGTTEAEIDAILAALAALL